MTYHWTENGPVSTAELAEMITADLEYLDHDDPAAEQQRAMLEELRREYPEDFQRGESEEDTMESIIKSVARIIEEAERHSNAYFWSAPCGAKERRNYEDRHTVPEVSWTEGGHVYTAEYTVRCSCRNVYARGYYTRDGAKTTLTAIRNSLNRMKQK